MKKLSVAICFILLAAVIYVIYVFAEWIIRQQIIIAVMIAVTGWIITYKLNIKANEKSYLDQIVNNSRIEIIKAIHDYNDWLRKINVMMYVLPGYIISWKSDVELKLPQNKIQEKYFNFLNELSLLIHGANFNWCTLLYEYELLFPFTAECRDALCERHSIMQDYSFKFYSELQSALFESIEKKEAIIIDKVSYLKEISTDQMGLMQDLLVHLQNYCLSKISGHALPARKPGDLSVPILAMDNKGMLQIVVPQNIKSSEQG